MTLQSEYIIGEKGTLRIRMEAQRDPVFPYLPRFGVRLVLPEEYEQVTYIGYGPYESYADKHWASWYDRFTTTVDGLHEDYIKPQENGSHWGCDWLSISDGTAQVELQGNDFSFNVSHYSQEQLAHIAHNYELQRENKIYLCVDGAMSGLGSGSCGPHLLEKYQVQTLQPKLDILLRFQ